MTLPLHVLAATLVLATACSAFHGAPEHEDDGSEVGDTAQEAAADDTGSEAEEAPPEPPAGLTRWITGDDADAEVTPLGPGLLMVGGGVEPDDAFRWQAGLLAGGDVVVLRASGEDGYNDWLHEEIGGVDSVETLLVDRRELAEEPYVAWRIAHAEAVFIAGGDQWVYLSEWGGTGLQAAIHTAWERGAVVGGTSAGLAVLGDRAFSAERGTVYSEEALEDPYNAYMTFEDDFLALPPLAATITDSHFRERDRLGRLVAFVARMRAEGVAEQVYGIGIDEHTALAVGPDGTGRVYGDGSVFVVEGREEPEVCEPGELLQWSRFYLELYLAGEELTLPLTTAGMEAAPVAVEDGELVASAW